MARLPRLALDGQLHHLVHRAAPGCVISLVEQDRSDYLAHLLTVSREAGVSIHAYAVLPDRIQLLFTPQRGADLSPMMQRLGRRYVGAYNARHGRSGTPFDGRYRTTVLQASLHLIDAMRHVEMGPVAADLVERADQWAASSASHHFGRRLDPLVTEHGLYFALGNTPFDREVAYRRLCDAQASLDPGRAIEAATAGGWVLGDAQFVSALSAQQARRLQPIPRGRPVKSASP